MVVLSLTDRPRKASTAPVNRKACHTCRRQRLTCDRSLPHCRKCITRGQECLGYGRLLRWEQGVASRGRMAGKRLDDVTSIYEGPLPDHQSPALSVIVRADSLSPMGSPSKCLTEPSLQDHASRKYISFFASDVCKAFVLYDDPKHNRFMELIPMAFSYPALEQILVANAALYMSNVYQGSLTLDSADASRNQLHCYRDALVAKQRAFLLLQSALQNVVPEKVELMLATILLFVEFELIDTGRDDWKHHIRGAKILMRSLCATQAEPRRAVSQLQGWLTSHCIIYDIIGSAFGFSADSPSAWLLTESNRSLLQDAEGNHCSSFPVALLLLMQAGAELLNNSAIQCPMLAKRQAVDLLHAAKAFDPRAWAADIQQRSPVSDLHQRTHIACAHRAAMCIYLSRIALSVGLPIELAGELKDFVREVLDHLSCIAPSDELFTATAWPAFIAGLEANDASTREWATRRFQHLWALEPWGLFKEAMNVLHSIWQTSEQIPAAASDKSKSASTATGSNWIARVRGMGVSWLIA